MAIKLHRCPFTWLKMQAHPCWRVESALRGAGVQYERALGPTLPRSRRTDLIHATGQDRYPAIEFEDGSAYRAESKDMAETIRAGNLRSKASSGAAGGGMVGPPEAAGGGMAGPPA